jgi:hypothetical protein
MKWLIGIFCIGLCCHRGLAQDAASAQSLEYQLVHGPLAPTGDDSLLSTPAPPIRRLLPANMSWMEKLMWDTNGVFRNTGLASPLTPEVRKSELNTRRTMLTVHQIGGFVTWSAMAAAVVFGQRIIDHGRRSDRSMHQTFVTATIVTYSATGLLAVLSPPPLIRRDEVSTTTIHKTLAWVHFLGMVATPIIGAAISRRSSHYYDIAHFHQASAYITFAALTASMIIVTF